MPPAPASSAARTIRKRWPSAGHVKRKIADRAGLEERLDRRHLEACTLAVHGCHHHRAVEAQVEDPCRRAATSARLLPQQSRSLPCLQSWWKSCDGTSLRPDSVRRCVPPPIRARNIPPHSSLKRVGRWARTASRKDAAARPEPCRRAAPLGMSFPVVGDPQGHGAMHRRKSRVAGPTLEGTCLRRLPAPPAHRPRHRTLSETDHGLPGPLRFFIVDNALRRAATRPLARRYSPRRM